MTTPSFSWLHLTDLHFGLKGQGCLWPNLRGPFLDDLVALHKLCGPWDAVLFTGDLVQSGKSEEFKKMQAEVLAPLWRKLQELGSGDAVLLAVPGNHDLYRPDPNEDNPAAERLLEVGGYEKVQDKFWQQPTGSYRRVINHAFAAYLEWWNQAPHRPANLKTSLLPGDFAATLEKSGKRIGLIGLNTAFLQLAGGDYQERLAWDAQQLHDLCEGRVDVWSRAHDVCLLLSHHGPEWLSPAARQHGETEIAPAGRFAAHLFGHQHETAIRIERKGGSTKATRLFQNTSLFGMEKFGEPPQTLRAHGYMAGRIEFTEQQTTLRLWPRKATNKTGGWRYIPDQENAEELQSDGGTAPEILSTHPVAAGLPAITPPPRQPTASAPHSTLPSPRPFFGRKKELADIAQWLSPQDRSWGVVIDGPGGMGKTALALEAAHQAPAEHFPLKLWVTAKSSELTPEGEQARQDYRVDDFNALLVELGQALGLPDIGRNAPEDRPGLIRHALAGQRALLVLDNLESFNPQERQRIYELLGALPVGCRALLTSRRRSGTSTAGHTLRLDKLERDAAEELLNDLSERLPDLKYLTPAERDRLYLETGGNPLLLTWTAGQLGRTTGRCRTLDKAVARLQEAHRLHGLDENNDPLAFIFGDLVDTFTPEETAVLAALAHFTQPARLDWLPPLANLSRKAAETALDGLRDRALLLENADTWLLPPLAATYLRRVRPEAVNAGGERLADEAYALALENGYDEYDRFPTLEAAWPRLAAALPLLLAGDNRRLQTVCSALKSFLNFSGRWDDKLALSRAAEARAVAAQDWRNAGWRAYDVGYCHVLRRESAEVLASAERAAAHWQAAGGGARERATTFFLRGLGHQLAQDTPAAIAAHREALDLYRSQAPRSEDVAIGLNTLAGALHLSGDLDAAESAYREALALARELSYAEGVAYMTGNLAELALDRERWAEAEGLAREALKLDEPVGRKQLIAEDCRRLAKALARQGRGGEGLGHAERAVALFSELRSPDLAKAQATLAECRAGVGGA